MHKIEQSQTIKINDITFTFNEHGLPLFEGRALGCLKWGHPALLAWFGSHYASQVAWDESRKLTQA